MVSFFPPECRTESASSDIAPSWAGPDANLGAYIRDQSQKTLKAYFEQPDLVEEHANVEQDTVRGGYARRQLFELVQNGADALSGAHGGGRIAIRLVDNRFYCANDGTSIDRKGVKALMLSHMSPKRGTEEIGRFGLGFKSVLGVTDTPEFFSRAGSFRFDRQDACEQIKQAAPEADRCPVLRVAEPVDPHEARGGDAVLRELMDWATNIVRLPLKPDAADDLREQMQNFPAEFLLFVQHVRQLSIGDGATLDRVLELKSVGNEFSLIDNGAPSRWGLFKVVHPLSSDARSDLDDGDKVPIWWAAPLDRLTDSGHFWAYFPTETASLVAGILNAPWKTNEDRQNLLRGPYNDELIDAAAEMVADKLPQLATRVDPANHLDALPRRRASGDPVHSERLRQSLAERLCKREVIPDQKGTLRGIPQVNYPPQELTSDTKRCAKALARWEQSAGRPPNWLHQRAVTRIRLARIEQLIEEWKSWKSGDQHPGDAPDRASVSAWLEALVTGKKGEAAVEASRDALLTAAAIPPDVQRRHCLGRIVLMQDESWQPIDKERVFLPRNESDYGSLLNVDKLIHEKLACDSEVRRTLQKLGINPESADSRLRRVASRLLGGEPGVVSDEAWRRFWELTRDVDPDLAKQVINHQQHWRAHLRVLAQSNDWVSMHLVLLPGTIVPSIDSREGRATVDLKFHEADKELLARLGVVSEPTPHRDLSVESRFSSFEKESRRRFKNRRTSSRAQNPYLKFISTQGAGPLDVLSVLSDKGRADYTDALLRLITTYDSWVMRHCTRPKHYPELKVETLTVHILRQLGRVRIAGDVVPLTDALGEQPKNPEARHALLAHHMAGRIKTAFGLTDPAEWSQVDPVLASIKAHLPLTLQQLDVKESEPLRDALREAEQAQRKREQVPSEATLKIEREALDRLAALIKDPENQKFLWKRVDALIRRYGYGEDSVLLELAQNADDALAEAAEIKGGSLPPATRRLWIRVHEHGGSPTVDVMHWGRPINDTGGTAFPGGRERQWDQDLYFMMLMNLSGKPGETPGESSLSSTTGRFGLGFKSVHLVSSSPSVISGFIGFSIAAGLFPQEQAVADEADSWMVEDRRATRIRLPLRPDREADTLIQRLFGRFSSARALLPVFARQVREVVVEGRWFPGIHVFDGQPVEGASGWSVGTETELPDHVGRWRILRFCPADAGYDDMGTAALAVGLREGVPKAFRSDVPFLWNVTPTSESWGCGYAVNGPFKLDPGRTHVSLDDDTTLRAVRGLGEALGRGLIELHDVLVDPTNASLGAWVNGDGRGFLSSLWKILASGLNDLDQLRRKFLMELHGNGRGVSAWMAVRSVVPTGLPAPFSPMLPRLNSGMSWEVAVDGLDCPDLCAVLAEIDDEDFRKLVGSRRIVSRENDRLLVPLCTLEGTDRGSTSVRPCDLLAELAERWDYRLTPARLHALRPLSQGEAWNLISSDPHGATWLRRLRAKAADGSCQQLRSLLLREASESPDEADGDLRDEFLRSAFAPNNRILGPVYIERSEDWSVFRWLRVQHRVDAAEMARWYKDLEEGLRPAAVRYLLDGALQNRVLSALVPLDARPLWLQNIDDVRRMLEVLCGESWRCESLLSALFPDRFDIPEGTSGVQTDSETFFQQLLEWWDDADVRNEVIATYEKDAWPQWLRQQGIASSLQADSEDHWLALMVLGACRSLGLARDDRHRRFLELAHGEGWWDVFKKPDLKTPDDADAWMRVLRDWQDDASDKLPNLRWMSLFPTIYQLSRYRDVYVRLLKSAGPRPESMYQVTHLLAPRVDEALTGAGTRFDAPPAPLNMGLHWVLRELVRLEVVAGEHLFPDCWVPSEQVVHLLEGLGLERLADGATNPEKAHAIFEFLACELDTATPNLHRAFDIPLRYVGSNEELRHRFGLEE